MLDRAARRAELLAEVTRAYARVLTGRASRLWSDIVRDFLERVRRASGPRPASPDPIKKRLDDALDAIIEALVA